MRERVGHVSLQAVYEALHALTAAGLIRRIEPAGSPARFEGRVGDNHHHLVCRSCGAVADVDCAVGEAPCLTAADDLGFSIDEAEVIYRGLCPDCSAAAVCSPVLITSLSTERSDKSGRILMAEQPRPSNHRSRDARRPRRGPAARARSGCPVVHGRVHPTQGDANSQWWPNRLNLKILAKNPAVIDPNDARASTTPRRSAPWTWPPSRPTSPRC